MYFDAKVDGMYYNTFISIQYIIPYLEHLLLES